MHKGGFHLGADKFGKRVAQFRRRLPPFVDLDRWKPPSTSFCIFFSSLSDRASRLKSAIGAVRVLNVPILIARCSIGPKLPAGRGRRARVDDRHFRHRQRGAGIRFR